jgi:hypothetical protein
VVPVSPAARWWWWWRQWVRLQLPVPQPDLYLPFPSATLSRLAAPSPYSVTAAATPDHSPLWPAAPSPHSPPGAAGSGCGQQSILESVPSFRQRGYLSPVTLSLSAANTSFFLTASFENCFDAASNVWYFALCFCKAASSCFLFIGLPLPWERARVVRENIFYKEFVKGHGFIRDRTGAVICGGKKKNRNGQERPRTAKNGQERFIRPFLAVLGRSWPFLAVLGRS